MCCFTIKDRRFAGMWPLVQNSKQNILDNNKLDTVFLEYASQLACGKQCRLFCVLAQLYIEHIDPVIYGFLAS